jgi:hypothetical protein
LSLFKGKSFVEKKLTAIKILATGEKEEETAFVHFQRWDSLITPRNFFWL